MVNILATTYMIAARAERPAPLVQRPAEPRRASRWSRWLRRPIG